MFTSLEVVLEDLEQMLHEPLKFLHDNNKQHHSGGVEHYGGTNAINTTLFGERYFGRQTEVAKLIEVVTTMERDAAVQLKQGGGEGKTTSLDTVFISG